MLRASRQRGGLRLWRQACAQESEEPAVPPALRNARGQRRGRGLRRRLRRRQDLPRLIGAADMKRAWHTGIAPALSLSAALAHAQATPQIAPPLVPAAPAPATAAAAPV